MTTHWSTYFAATVPVSVFALAGWMFSLARNQVNHVDAMWPLFIGMSAYVYALFTYDLHPRAIIVLILTTLWALRLCAHLSWRIVYLPLDQRHQQLAKKLQTVFWFKSLYHLFLLYGFLAWLVSMPLFAAIQGNTALGLLDVLGITLIVSGLVLETTADWQLSQFRKRREHDTEVFSKGLWAFSRHPNYFGELCVWTGFFVIALSTGAWWSGVSLLILGYLIFYGSGVQLIEPLMRLHKPDYLNYQQTTNLILPFK